MQKILDATGGAQRWCPIIILLVIFLALMGYVYNLVTKKKLNVKINHFKHDVFFYYLLQVLL